MADHKPCLGGCDALAKRLGIIAECCSSCHEDHDEGYSEIGDYEMDDGWYECCCAMHSCVEKHRQCIPNPEVSE